MENGGDFGVTKMTAMLRWSLASNHDLGVGNAMENKRCEWKIIHHWVSSPTHINKFWDAGPRVHQRVLTLRKGPLRCEKGHYVIKRPSTPPENTGISKLAADASKWSHHVAKEALSRHRGPLNAASEGAPHMKRREGASLRRKGVLLTR